MGVSNAIVRIENASGQPMTLGPVVMLTGSAPFTVFGDVSSDDGDINYFVYRISLDPFALSTNITIPDPPATRWSFVLPTINAGETKNYDIVAEAAGGGGGLGGGLEGGLGTGVTTFLSVQRPAAAPPVLASKRKA